MFALVQMEGEVEAVLGQDLIDVFVISEKFVGRLGGQEGDGTVRKSFP